MLGKVLGLLRDSRGPLRLEEIAQALGMPASAAEGMLETLERLGKIERVEAELCERCPARRTCIVADGKSPCYRRKAP